MEIVCIRIKHYETNYKDTSESHAVSRLKPKIKELQKTYMFVPAHKAADNIVVICKVL